MKIYIYLLFIILLFPICNYAQELPFDLSTLNKIQENSETIYGPKNNYNAFINYELGMHCVGFDMSYCCVIPPYNSIQAQIIKSGSTDELPKLIDNKAGIKPYYFIRDNSYSEGNKMNYWGVPKDVDGDGLFNSPNDNFANYVWDHLYIYSDLIGTLPANRKETDRLYVGIDMPIPIDAGPSGMPIGGDYLEYWGEKGGNIVFVETLVPWLKDVPITLTASKLWDALGLPLTAFNDSTRIGSIRKVNDLDFQPYQESVVQLHDDTGKPLLDGNKVVEFFGTNPVDIPNCYVCHSGNGLAARLAVNEGLNQGKLEYNYWKNNFRDISDYMARQREGSINILELHDAHYGTQFLKDYNPKAATNRLGSVGSVNCTDCHGDNISGNLYSPRKQATGYTAVKARPLSKSIHWAHMRFVPLPDRGNRTQNCQACHPTHWQVKEMNDFNNNPYSIIDYDGNVKFSDSDVRVAGGGCYLRRDAHTNPAVKEPYFLNSLGKWYLKEISQKDELGNPLEEKRGLYCTHCHNKLSQELYVYDDLNDVIKQTGKTLRNKSVDEVKKILANNDDKYFRDYLADPKIYTDRDSPLIDYYGTYKGAVLAKSEGVGSVLPWNSEKGAEVRYIDASAGDDYWLASGEPHCANCHIAPFVESEGGKYFPIDQPNKYSLYRYSKAHGDIACQSCHESIHGLYPVRYEGPEKTVDLTTHNQALQFSPDGQYTGPVTCAACHSVNSKGVPVQLKNTPYYDDYFASLVLMHYMRDNDINLSISELIKKYPYDLAKAVLEASKIK